MIDAEASIYKPRKQENMECKDQRGWRMRRGRMGREIEQIKDYLRMKKEHRGVREKSGKYDDGKREKDSMSKDGEVMENWK